MTAKHCTITLLEHSFDIKCPEGEEGNLQLAAEKINHLMRQKKVKSNNINDFQALMLAALTVSHELIRCQEEAEEQRIQFNQFIASLEQKINKAVTPEPQAEPEN